MTETRFKEDSERSKVDSQKDEKAQAELVPPEGKVSMKINMQAKPKNVFAAAKKNALAGKKALVIEQPKKMSEAERIMKEEIERKRSQESSGSGASAQM